MPNRLAHETSLYLKQHENNPVDWYAWGPDALNRARREDKPILLSVGYSACHWCHVMGHECFENPEIAAIMNREFVNIKVDREERPDLDQIYQNVAQVFTQGGGWPLTVFLTPDLKPFFGGTYFPPEDRSGRPGLPRVLLALAKAYRMDRASVLANAEKLTDAISKFEKIAASEPVFPSLESLRALADKLCANIDWRNGGFGAAPKFPNSMTFSLLWRMGTLTSWSEGKAATVLSLVRMAQGGIFDHLGGGFHRYSVDEKWAVPHFEKMLYDNGLLLRLYAEVLLTDQLFGSQTLQDAHRELFLDTIEQTVNYLLREMRSPEGVFYSAQDADSEGEEGKFFSWDPTELQKALGKEASQAFCSRYGVREAGNFEHQKTVLSHAKPIEVVARELGRDPEALRLELEQSRVKLFKLRETRVKPGLDKKIIVAWNGLVISGLAWAAQALSLYGRSQSAENAERAAEAAFSFIQKNIEEADGKLSSTWQSGQPKFNAYLDDYAFMARASLDLSRFAKDPSHYIRAAERWLERVIEHFRDPSASGYFFTSADHESLLLRPKSLLDQAIPSGTSVVIESMLALVEIDPESKISARFRGELMEVLPELYARVSKSPYGSAELLSAALLAAAGPTVKSGEFGRDLIHPHLYQKKDSASLLCHRQSCRGPFSDSAALKKELIGLLLCAY